MTNRLYYGDNLDILRREIKDESVALIYLDPPFNSSNLTYSNSMPWVVAGGMATDQPAG